RVAEPFDTADELGRVEALIASHGRAASSAADPMLHAQSCLPLGSTVGLGEIDINHQAMSVLHQNVAGETQLGRLTGLWVASLASGSVFEAWVSFDRLSPRQFTSGFRPSSLRPPPRLRLGLRCPPRFGLAARLLREALASSRVPSTVK